MVTIAIYQGEKFKAGELDNGNITLITEDRDYLSKGFIEHANIGRHGTEYVYTKEVTKQEVTEFYSEYERYYWSGYELGVRSQTETQYELTGTPDKNYKTAERLGMTLIDKYEYGIWVNKSDVIVKKFRKNRLTGEVTLLNP